MSAPSLEPPERRMDRRTFLRFAGLAATGAVVAACGGGAPRAAPTTARRSPTPPVGTPTGPPDWSSLQASLKGRLVLPADPGYPVAHQLYDPRFDSIHPKAIAYCESASDVQRCVEFVTTNRLAVAARSGGHSYGGYSTGHGLVIDVTSMDRVDVGPGRAVVGAGTHLVDLYAGLAAHGVLVPGGSCPTVGVAGLTLGGGIGVVGRKYGLTSDNVTALSIVTADGSLLRCDEGRNADLFWACQGGGGGNFGVVTSFTFSTHPATDLSLFTLDWPWSAASDVVPAWLDWAPNAPDELWSNCLLLGTGPGASPTLKVTGVYVGGTSALSGLLQGLRAAIGTPPSNSFVGANSYLETMMIEAGCSGLSVAECHLPSQNPQGRLPRESFAAGSDFVAAPLGDAGVAALIQGVQDRATSYGLSGGGVLLDAAGGAINRVPAAATAFVHRNDLCSIQYSAPWMNGAPRSVVNANWDWLDSYRASMAPHVSGYCYQNYIDPRLNDWRHAYYGSNLPRLVQVKARYDPDDVFHFAQSIPTST